MSKRGGENALSLEIGSIVIPASYDARDLAARVEREIADRRFGPGRDPVVSAIAARLTSAIESVEELR
jgi:hypothetical protein